MADEASRRWVEQLRPGHPRHDDQAKLGILATAVLAPAMVAVALRASRPVPASPCPAA